MNAGTTSAAGSDAEVEEEAVGVVRALVGGPDIRVLARLKRGKSDVLIVATGGPADRVIAKCARADTVANEAHAMALVRAAPLPSLAVHGTLPARTAERAWLVAEAADGVPVVDDDPAHRRAVARWLAGIHAWSAATGPLPLPDRGPAHHRRIVADAAATIDAAIAAIGAAHPGQGALATVRAAAADLLGSWDAAAIDLTTLPATIVHGGVAGKNLCLGGSPGHPAILAFDWETAGWGCAARDLKIADLATYTAEVRRSWPVCGAADVRRVAQLGRILWCMAALPGERENLTGPHPERALRKVEHYAAVVTDASIAGAAAGAAWARPGEWTR